MKTSTLNERSRVEPKAIYAGRVKWFNPQKAYGFLTVDKVGHDVRSATIPDPVTSATIPAELFLHITAFDYKCAPQPGDAVEFQIQAGPRGPRAAHARLLNPQPVGAEVTRRH
jgi:cold shock CspA family protein